MSAADGYARGTGEVAVAYPHTHVGLANALANLNAGRLARSPVIVLTGLEPTRLQSHRGFTCVPDTGRLPSNRPPGTAISSARNRPPTTDVARRLDLPPSTRAAGCPRCGRPGWWRVTGTATG